MSAILLAEKVTFTENKNKNLFISLIMYNMVKYGVNYNFLRDYISKS